MRCSFALLSPIAVALALVCAAWAPNARVYADEAPRTLAGLQQAVEDALGSSPIPGASVVVIEDRAIAWVGHYGVADRDTGRVVDDATIFRAGSISKSLTGIAAMMLVEQGLIGLDDVAVEAIPSLDLDNPWSRDDPVRLVHLLEHTAGFNDIAFHHYLIEGGGMPLAEAVARFGPYISRWRPGTLTSYSNQGPIVAARMLEVAAGEPLEQFMRRRVTEPLAMRSAVWSAAETPSTRLAASYRPDGVTPERFVDTPGWPSGGLNLTARDLARLPLLMLGRGTLDGVALLSPASVQRIESPRSSIAARAGLVHGYGLGNVAKPRGKVLFHGHDGSIDGFVSTFAYAPTLGAGYVIMANATSEAIFEAADRIRGYLERGSTQPAIDPIDDAGGPEAWAGQYQVLTPRRALLAGLIGLTQWEGAHFDGGRLAFRGGVWSRVGENLWQRSDSAVPELVSLEIDGELRLDTATATYRRVPSIEMWAKIAVLAAFVGLLVIGVPHAILVAWTGWRGKLAERGGLAMRAWPLAALYATAGVVVYTLLLFQTGDLEFIGRPTPAAWGLFFWSAVAPLVVLLAWLAVLRRRPTAAWRARILAAAYASIAGIACVYLALHGWIGLRLWTA